MCLILTITCNKNIMHFCCNFSKLHLKIYHLNLMLIEKLHYTYRKKWFKNARLSFFSKTFILKTVNYVFNKKLFQILGILLSEVWLWYVPIPSLLHTVESSSCHSIVVLSSQALNKANKHLLIHRKIIHRKIFYHFSFQKKYFSYRIS